MTSQTNINCKAVEVTEVIASQIQNKNMLDEVKKHSRTSPDVQFEEFSLTKQITRPKTDYERIGKTISEKIKIRKIKKAENQCLNVACKEKIR